MLKNKKLFWVVLLVLFGPLLALFLYFSEPVSAYHDAPTGASTNDSGETVIVTFPNETVTFGDTNTAPQGVYKGTIDGNPCQSYLELDTANGTAILTVRDGDGTSCQEHATHNIAVAGETPDSTNPGDDGTQEEESPNCQSTVGGELSWLACPVSTLLVNVLDALADWLSNLLQVTPLTTDSAAFSVWENMRNIALVVFALALVVVIFGQSVGIDAYTVKRIAPRLGVAAIGIMLSFYVAAFMIDVFNVLGQGMYSLMLGTLEGQGITVSWESTFAEWATFAAALSTGAFLAISGGLFYLFSILLIPIVMAFLAGFAVVLVRQVILILLVVISPIAIAAIVLPNTNPWFKRWWSLFSSLLMMYPIIMILLASGSIFAVIVTGDGGGGTITESNFFNQLIALAALGFTVGLIPFTLRASSSLLGRIASVVNNPNRGPIDRWRQAAYGKADKKRDIRRQNKVSEYGNIQRDEEKGGTKKPFRKAWLRATTGLYGVGGGEYGKTHRAEEIAQARTGQQRQTIAQEKAKRETAQFADFDMQKRVSEMEASGMERDDIAKELSSIARSDFGSIDSDAAARAIVTQRLEPQLNEVFDHVATKGKSSQKQALAQFKQENFGNIDSFAAHLSRGEFTTNNKGEVAGFSPAYGQLAGLNPEQLSTQRGIKSALIHAGNLAEQGNQQIKSSDPEVVKQGEANIDKAKKLTTNLVSTYANTASHQRTADNNKLFADAAAGFVDLGNGKQHVEIPKPSSEAVDRFTANVGTSAENIPEGSKKVSAESVIQHNKSAQTTVSTSGLGSDAPPPSPASRVESYGSSVAPQTEPARSVKGQQIKEVYEVAQRRKIPLDPGSVTTDNVDTFRNMLDLDKTPSPPSKSRVTRQQVKNMGEQNVTAFIQDSGGYEGLHQGELLSIANEYGSSETGKQARAELTKRGGAVVDTPSGQERVQVGPAPEPRFTDSATPANQQPEPPSVPSATAAPATTREEGAERLSSKSTPSIPGSEEVRNRPSSSSNQPQQSRSGTPQSSPPENTPPEDTPLPEENDTQPGDIVNPEDDNQ